MSHVKLKDVDPDAVEVGYSLMSEEHRPNELVRYAQLAENAGFTFATISDHYHPWTSTEGNSPFVWATIGGIKLLIGEWGELGERMIPMYVFVCPNCGKVELYATEDLRQKAVSIANSNQP